MVTQLVPLLDVVFLQHEHTLFADGKAGYRWSVKLFRKVIRHHGKPEVVTIDKRGAYTAALSRLNTGKSADEVIIRQNKKLKKLIEQDRRN